MLRDIYIRNPQDPNYKGEDIIEFSDVYEEILTQVRVLLSTRKGEVIGNYNFGVGVEDLVFSTNLDASALETEINSQIAVYIAPACPDYPISCKVGFGHHEEGWDYAVIDVYINGKKQIGIGVV